MPRRGHAVPAALPVEHALTDIAPPPASVTPVTPAPPASPASTERKSASKRLPFIDALRGIAAMWVVIFHIGEGGQIATLQAVIPAWFNSAFFKSGHFGVPIFFVLSGFVIAHAIGSVRVDGRYALRFITRRRLRLDPPYVASDRKSVV